MLSARLRAELSCVIFDDDGPRGAVACTRYASHKGELAAYTRSVPVMWDVAKAERGLFLSEIELPVIQTDAWGERISADVVEKRRIAAIARHTKSRNKKQANA